MFSQIDGKSAFEPMAFLAMCYCLIVRFNAMVHGAGLGVSGTADLSRPSKRRHRKRRGGGWEAPNIQWRPRRARWASTISVKARSVVTSRVNACLSKERSNIGSKGCAG